MISCIRKYWLNAPLFVFALFLCLAGQPALSNADDADPLSRVESIYAHFTGSEPGYMSDFDMLLPMAAPALKALIEQEVDCQEKAEDICKYGASVIVDGQDFDLSDLDISETLNENGTVEITATFRNFGHPSTVVYLFSDQSGDWLLDDVQVRGEYPVSLLEMLQ